MTQTYIESENGNWEGCHAATLAGIGDGNVVVAWFGGSHEGNDDVGIWLTRRIGTEWEPQRCVAKVDNTPHWNPVLFDPGNGKLFLYFKIGKPIPDWMTWVMESSDQGATWSDPVELVKNDRSGGRGPVKNKPIVLSNGSWIAPSSVETLNDWQAFCDLSYDDGKTWQKSNTFGFADDALEGKGIIQPTLWESNPGNVHMLLRSTCGSICRSDSTDSGLTWTPAVPTGLPNNNSGIDLVKLDGGELVLIYNPTSERSRRTPLRVSLSHDNGSSWASHRDIEDENVTVGHLIKQDGGEFSYPSIIAKEGRVFAAYTCHRRKLGLWEDSVESLLETS